MTSPAVLVIGAGPAGLAAAIAAAQHGATVQLVDEGVQPGGQLRYLRRGVTGTPGGVQEHPAAIAARLIQRVMELGVEIHPLTTVWAAFGDGTYGTSRDNEPMLIGPKVTVVATGSTDLPLVFAGGSLPGVFTGRAVLKMANEWGVLPCKRWAVIGSSRIAEVEESIIAACGKVEVRIAPESDIHAHGSRVLEAVTVDGVHNEIDGIALCIGRQPDAALAMMSGVPFSYAADLGGFVPVLDWACSTSRPGLLVCGDAAGACTPEVALAEGAIAGTMAAVATGAASPQAAEKQREYFRGVLESRISARESRSATYLQPVR